MTPTEAGQMIGKRGVHMNLIECKKMNKNYLNGKIVTQVLKEIDLTIHANDFVGITGPSGSGKTTLLYVLSGLEKPSGGFLSLFGKSISDYSETDLTELRKHRIGFIFQFYNLVPNLTVKENMMLAWIIGKNHDEALIDELLELVGMKEFGNYYPNQISGGMQQRVAVARSLINDPEILFADEPTGNLDTETGKKIEDILVNLNTGKKITLIVVTHNKLLAERMSGRIGLRDGEVYDDY
jgi:putative ABC transport system ATP-binding protein